MDDVFHSRQPLLVDPSFPSGLMAPLGCPFEPGDMIAGRYDVRGVIGHGSTSFVLHAYDVRRGRELALKLLRPDLAEQEALVRRFRVDGMRTARVRNAHVLRVAAVDEYAPGRPFVVMELLQGRDLRQLLQEQRTLPVETATDYVLQACIGIAAAHAASVRRFELQPSHLFLVDLGDGDGASHVVLTDFGGAPDVSQGPYECTGDTLIGMGSPGDAPPEPERAVVEVHDRSDVWSLGCVLYELLAGEPVFARRSDPDGPRSSIILDEAVLGPRLECPDIPAELEQVIRRCLQGDPADRYADVAELAAALVPFGPAWRADTSERCAALLRGEPDPAEVPEAAPVADTAAVAPPVAAALGNTPIWSSSTALLSARPRAHVGVKLIGASLLAAALAGYGLYATGVHRGPKAVVSSSAVSPAQAPAAALDAQAAVPSPVASSTPVPSTPAAEPEPAGALPAAATRPRGPTAGRPRIRKSPAELAPVEPPEPDVGF